MFEKTYRPTMDGLAEAAADLDGALAFVPDSAKAVVMVAADEIFANIVRHSRASAWTLSVEETHDPEGVRLTFEDDGLAFDPLLARDPDTSLSAEERAVGGLGIFIVKKTMSPVTYERRNGKNVLTMTKSFERK